MFGWLFKKSDKKLEDETKKGFSAVKGDMDKIGKWIKHLSEQDKQLFETLNELKQELSTIKADVGELRETVFVGQEEEINKQVFKRLPVLHKQMAVEAVQDDVQTPVQTGNIYDILKNLTGNERLIVFALLNTENEMKLSYEDLAMMLGKEKSTIRGQVNAIKQKSEGLIEENTEKNGKKRVRIRPEIKEKLLKYAKVRVKGSKK